MNRLKIVRELAGYTQEQVATAHEVTAQTIQRFEKGTRNVSLAWLEKMAEFYKVRVSTLVDDVVEAEVDEALMREIMAYTFKRCEGENVDINKLTEPLELHVLWKMREDRNRKNKIKRIGFDRCRRKVRGNDEVKSPAERFIFVVLFAPMYRLFIDVHRGEL